MGNVDMFDADDDGDDGEAMDSSGRDTRCIDDNIGANVREYHIQTRVCYR